MQMSCSMDCTRGRSTPCSKTATAMILFWWPERPLTHAEAASRDRTEIENTNKGGPIAMADYTISNESSISDLKKQTDEVLAKLK